ncbi:hypothetical protein T261_8416 [Streptomyces lydicus]|nr:hypothetical protein T261_8416 [Streptomyces lydicus]
MTARSIVSVRCLPEGMGESFTSRHEHQLPHVIVTGAVGGPHLPPPSLSRL